MENNFLPDAIDLVTKAIAADNEGEYDKALGHYRDALERFLTFAKHEKNDAKRKLILERVEAYMKRAEELHEYLSRPNDLENDKSCGGGTGSKPEKDKEDDEERHVAKHPEGQGNARSGERGAPITSSDRIRALASAQHPRMGRLSAASALPKELLPFISEFIQDVATPIVQCDDCGFRLSGLRCRGTRNPELQVEINYSDGRPRVAPKDGADLPVAHSVDCGRLLVGAPGTKGLRCPMGHGRGFVLSCCRQSNQTQSMVIVRGEEDTACENKLDFADGDEAGPKFTCTRCGWTVDGAGCITALAPNIKEPRHPGRLLQLERNGFFERVACAYVWTCPEGCCRPNGGAFGTNTMRCMCDISQSDAGVLMETLDYVERHGPPCNY